MNLVDAALWSTIIDNPALFDLLKTIFSGVQ